MEGVEKMLQQHIHDEENKLKDLASDVKLIMGNHLVHIQASLTELEVKMKLVMWFLGIIGTLSVVEYFKK
jgi:hypothetical protein